MFSMDLNFQKWKILEVWNNSKIVCNLLSSIVFFITEKNYNQNQVHNFRELVHIPQILNTGPQKLLKLSFNQCQGIFNQVIWLFDPLL